jgi:hypothetical protein
MARPAPGPTRASFFMTATRTASWRPPSRARSAAGPPPAGHKVSETGVRQTVLAMRSPGESSGGAAATLHAARCRPPQPLRGRARRGAARRGRRGPRVVVAHADARLGKHELAAWELRRRECRFTLGAILTLGSILAAAQRVGRLGRELRADLRSRPAMLSRAGARRGQGTGSPRDARAASREMNGSMRSREPEARLRRYHRAARRARARAAQGGTSISDTVSTG